MFMNRTRPFLLATLVVIGVAPVTLAGEPISLSVGFDNRKMTREECARKAVEAMGVREKFGFAEVTGDGNAQGWNATSAVRVMSYPMPDDGRIYIVIAAAGHDQAETARVRQAVQAHVFDGPDDPKTPARIPSGGTPPPCPVTLSYKSAERAANTVLRHFSPVAEVVLEKKGYRTQTGTRLVAGTLPDRSVVTFLAPTASAVLMRLNVVYATPGEEAGDTTAEDLLSRILHVLYE
jgi:hypothetical protein